MWDIEAYKAIWRGVGAPLLGRRVVEGVLCQPRIFPLKVLYFRTELLYSVHVQINSCLRCMRDWAYRGEGRALRCGQCGSPYWDKERVHGKLVDDDFGGKAQRDGGRAGLPVLRKGKGDSRHVHKVQPVRDELAERGGRVEASPHEGHRIRNAGGRRWCSDCKVYVDEVKK